MNTLRTSILALLAAASAAQGQQRAPTSSAGRLTSTSSYEVLPRTESCTGGYRTTGVRYSIVGTSIFEGPPPHLVLEEKTVVEQCDNLEGPTRAEVSVVARPARNPAARPTWTVRRRGERGEVFDELPGEQLYRITEYGCCGSENLDSYYSLADGRLLFTADQPLLYIEATAFGTGMVAVHDAQAADDPPGAANDRTLVAAIAFGDSEHTPQRAWLRGPSADFWVKKVEWVARGPGGQVKRDRTLGVSDELNARWTVAVSIELEGMSEGAPAARVEIPVENGRLALEKARVPAPFRLAAAPAR
jgi:hypothetical protein